MQTKHLVRGLKGHGMPALLVCPDGSELYHVARREGLDVQGVRYGGNLDLVLVFKLIRIIRAVKPDIVHLHGGEGADTLGALAAKWAGHRNVIITCRSDRRISSGVLNRFCIGRIPRAITCVSDWISREMQASGFPSEKISVIHSAIDANEYHSAMTKLEARAVLRLPPNVPILAVIEQLAPGKGHAVLLNALLRLKNHFKNVLLLVVGGGVMRAQLENQVETLGLRENVQFIGFRSDISTILRASDLLIHPVLQEWAANVGLQAMASGIPVVTTNLGGMPEIVQHELTGLIVHPGDSEAMAHAVASLLSNPVKCSVMGHLGQVIVRERFSIEKMVASNFALYQKTLASRPS